MGWLGNYGTPCCVPAGWRGDSTQPCRCAYLCSSSPLGAVTQPVCVFWKTGREVGHLTNLQVPSPPSYSGRNIPNFIFQVALGKRVQHQHWHKHFRVPSSPKPSEYDESDGLVTAPLVSGCGNRSSLTEPVCLADASNEKQYRVHRRINQTFCVQPAPPPWWSQVIQCEVYSHQKPQCLLPPYNQVKLFLLALNQWAALVLTVWESLQE